MKEEIVNAQKVVRNYKDTVFRMLFNSKKELLTCKLQDKNVQKVENKNVQVS